MKWTFLFLMFSQTPGEEFESQRREQLLAARRVHVDKLTGDGAEQIRDMLIAALQRSKLFIITENPEKADAAIRGTAEDLIFTDRFESSEGVSARGSAGRSSSRPSTGVSVGERNSVRISERRHEARAALRMVSRDGDIIWSTTQESLGAKFKGASADVADKVAQRLVEDYQLARKGTAKP